ncbi:MAG: ABC transporter ATP-binding protein [Desulfurococcaceae archaeon]|jgi:branched-chain amino acid transport system ATP-binding protein|nr:ABC transporter ATP-binding protein [Desulfurococcaceae archaeon]
MLETYNINAGYGEIQVLWDVSLKIEKGEIIALLGPNGAGKTTLTKVLIGLLKPYSGVIKFNGIDITNTPPYERVKIGISLVPEGRQIFPYMTVLENLYAGMYSLKKMDKEAIEHVFEIFPRLKERVNQKAGSLSGGEQQMLAIARALVTKPKVLILDEPSQGLAPKIVGIIFDVLKKLRDEENISILLIEQYIYDALSLSDRTYIMRNGRIVYEESSSKILTEKRELLSLYLG